MLNGTRKIVLYERPSGETPFEIWLAKLKDREAKSAIARSLKRIAQGNFGDWKRFGPITEIRIHIGPGYRLYVAQDGPVLVLLLLGGDKSVQSRDFFKAKEYWDDYQARKG